MESLRDVYHKLRSKISVVCDVNANLIDILEDMELSSTPDDIADLLTNCAVIKKAAFEALGMLDDIRSLHYRQVTDPDGDYLQMKKAVKDSNKEKKILFVDDEQDLCEVYCRSFKSKGFASHKASNKDSAIRMLSEVVPDVVVLDLHLQRDGEGLEVLRTAKEQYPNMKVLIISNEKRPDKVKEAYNAGVDDFLLKPIGPGELHAKINAMVA